MTDADADAEGDDADDTQGSIAITCPECGEKHYVRPGQIRGEKRGDEPVVAKRGTGFDASIVSLTAQIVRTVELPCGCEILTV